MPSIAGNTATFQALFALRESGGLALEANSQEAAAAQSWLARRGFYVERSSAAALAGLQKAITQGHVSQADRVVLLITSHGYKEAAG